MGRTTQRKMVTIAMLVSILLVAIDTTIITTAMPHIVQQLSGLNLLSWVFAIYLLTSTVTTPIYGSVNFVSRISRPRRRCRDTADLHNHCRSIPGGRARKNARSIQLSLGRCRTPRSFSGRTLCRSHLLALDFLYQRSDWNCRHFISA